MMGAKLCKPRSGFSYHFADHHFAWSLLFILLTLRAARHMLSRGVLSGPGSVPAG